MPFSGPFNPTGQPGHFLLDGGVHVTLSSCSPANLVPRYPWQGPCALLKFQVVPMPFNQSIHRFEWEEATQVSGGSKLGVGAVEEPTGVVNRCIAPGQ